MNENAERTRYGQNTSSHPHSRVVSRRKSALFSLASEILIVNLWEHQVGLYQGASMGLLKTVFEVNLGLFCRPTGMSLITIF